MKTLSEYKTKYSYVNPYITEENFPKPDRVWNDYKVYHFDIYISSKDVIKEMQKDGYEPANLYELLEWDDNKTYYVVALGSAPVVDGDRRVGVLNGDDSNRKLDLFFFGGAWLDRCRFLAVRNLELSNSNTSPKPSVSLSLEEAIKICKENGLIVTKTY